jgi:hypothetical protein
MTNTRRRGYEMGWPRWPSYVARSRTREQYWMIDFEVSILACRNRANTDTTPALYVDWWVLIRYWIIGIGSSISPSRQLISITYKYEDSSTKLGVSVIW